MDVYICLRRGMKWMNECNKTAEWTVKDVEIPAMKRRTIGMRKVDVVDRLALAHTLPISFYLLRIHSLQFTERCSRRGKSTHSNRPSTSMGCLGVARWTDGGKYVVRNQCDSVFFSFFFIWWSVCRTIELQNALLSNVGIISFYFSSRQDFS